MLDLSFAASVPGNRTSEGGSIIMLNWCSAEVYKKKINDIFGRIWSFCLKM